eukprot:3479595-Rhodomonas_salina.2
MLDLSALDAMEARCQTASQLSDVALNRPTPPQRATLQHAAAGAQQDWSREWLPLACRRTAC